MNRAILNFTLTNVGGSVSGDDEDTHQTLLAALLEKWPGELVRASSDGVRVYQQRRKTSSFRAGI